MSREPFPGFPAKSSYTPLPDMFFSRLLPEAEDIGELKVLLHIFWRLYRKKGSARFVTLEELEADEVLARGLGADPARSLGEALSRAVEHGFLLQAAVQTGGQARKIFAINGEAGRRALAGIDPGQTFPNPEAESAPASKVPPNIFVLYEQNIGLLTPMIAEELKEAEKLYPPSWIEDAFREASNLNKRSWRYISRILERWATEGRGSGEPGRDSKKKGNPGRYFKGKYGSLVQR